MLKDMMDTLRAAFEDWQGTPNGYEEVERHTLAELLPYVSYSEGDDLYSGPGSVGFILEGPPLTGADEQMVRTLTGMITDSVPDQCTLQFMIWASPKVAPLFDSYKELRQGQGEVFETLARKRAEYLSQGTWRSLADGAPVSVRNFRVIIAASLPDDSKDRSREKLQTLRRNLKSSLKSIHLRVEDVRPPALMSLMDEILCPNREAAPREFTWDKNEFLARQMTSKEYALEVSPKGISWNGGETVARCLGVRQLPEVWGQWQMGMLIGHELRELSRVEVPFLSHFSITFDGDADATRMKLKNVRTIREAESPMAKYMPSKIKEAQSVRFVAERVEQGQKVVQGFYQVVVFSDAERIDEHEQALKDLYKSEGWQLETTKYLQLPAFLACLPLGQYGAVARDLRRLNLTKTMVSWTCANVAPLQGEWRGNGTPRVMLLGRRGQVMFFDPFTTTEGNYNIAIMGKSGSGKSVWMQDLVVSLRGSGGQVFVIDDGRSFMNTCLLVGGKFVEFTLGKGLILNPFSFIDARAQEDEHYLGEVLQFLVQIIGQMAHPRSELSEVEAGLVEAAVRDVWNNHGQKATVTHVAAWLAKHARPEAHSMAISLTPYCKEGMHGAFFEGQCNLPTDNKFVVFEMNELQTKPELRSVVLMILMFLVTQRMYQGGRGERVSLVIDEAWQLLQGGMGGDFIAGIARRARKYSGNLITATQGIDDFYKSPAAQAAIENSDWRVILGLKTDAIDQAVRAGRLSDNPHFLKMVKSLKMMDGVYSECLIQGPPGVVVGRLLLDPFTGTLFSSKGAVFEQIAAARSAGLSIEQAVERAMRGALSSSRKVA